MANSVHESSFCILIISPWILASRMTKRLLAISEKHPSYTSQPVHPPATRWFLVVPTSELYPLIALPAYTRDQERNQIWLKSFTLARDWEESLYSSKPGFSAGGGAPYLNTSLLSCFPLFQLFLRAFAHNSNRNSSNRYHQKNLFSQTFHATCCTFHKDNWKMAWLYYKNTKLLKVFDVEDGCIMWLTANCKAGRLEIH